MKKKPKRKPATKKSEPQRPNFPPRLDIAHDCKIANFNVPNEASFADAKVYPRIVWS